ncbi:MAG: hypothetical protein DID92_2727745670 [Candidatus Nitrotoga sp. SPKER]|nr:MAG: hypothetical protein DID92_2727745670 [Candidatus Nitrotoga sp. SPKER]
MALPNVAIADELGHLRTLPNAKSDNTREDASAVSWGAIVAGAAAAAALSLILLILGTGLGLSSVSPWAYSGISATTFGLSTILWVTFTQLVASGMGGYLAGRLRTKWVAVHTDEVYFRDTAHGFLAWAVASLVTAALLTSVIGSIISGGIQASASVAGGVTTAATAATVGSAAVVGSEKVKSDNNDSESIKYFVDYLFRKDTAIPVSSATGNSARSEDVIEQTTIAPTAEVARIFMNTIQTGTLAPEDVKYVGQIISQRTGLTQRDAEKRVSETYARIQAKLHDAEVATKDAANKARKASAYAALWIFVSLLGGAFVASLAATFGGRRRDL